MESEITPDAANPVSQWNTTLVQGSDLMLKSGRAGTAKHGGDYTQESFSGESTAILGAPNVPAMVSGAQTEVSWEVPIDPLYVRNFKQGFLIISCLRFFGGLHSQFYNSRAAISLNGGSVDWVDLRIQPEHHSDYFHRPPIPEFPKIARLADCPTLYAWRIPKEKLKDAPNQTVGVSIDWNVWWDIDYVGLVLNAMVPRSRIFLCHGSEDKDAVRRLYSRLKSDGLDPWLDEKDILPGEEWDGAILNAIRNSGIVLVCLSQKSVSKTGYVQKEIRTALDKADEQPEGAIYVVPVRLEECQVPQRLSKWQYLNLFEDGAYDRLLELFKRQKLG